MSLTNNAFRTPKGDTFVDSDGATVTIASASTWTSDTALVGVANIGLSDFSASAGKIEPAASYPQKTKMRVQFSIAAHATTGTNTLDVRLYDSTNSEVLVTSDEGPTAVVTTTPATFTGDAVVEIPTDADIVVQVTNNTDTDNVVITTSTISLWHP